MRIPRSVWHSVKDDRVKAVSLALSKWQAAELCARGGQHGTFPAAALAQSAPVVGL